MMEVVKKQKKSLLFLILISQQLWAQQATEQTIDPVDLNTQIVFTNSPVTYSTVLQRNQIRQNPAPGPQRPQNLHSVDIRSVNLQSAAPHLLGSLRSCGSESFEISMNNSKKWTCRSYLTSENFYADSRVAYRSLMNDIWSSPSQPSQKEQLQRTCEQIMQRNSFTAPRALEHQLNRVLSDSIQWRTHRNLYGVYQPENRQCSLESHMSLTLSETPQSRGIVIECKPQQPPFSISFSGPVRNGQQRNERQICERSSCTGLPDQDPDLCRQFTSLADRATNAEQFSLGNLKQLLENSFASHRGALFRPLYIVPPNRQRLNGSVNNTPAAGID